MNEFKENVYIDIKNELLQSVIDKKVDTYFVGKIFDAQGGEERAKYGNELIKKILKD